MDMNEAVSKQSGGASQGANIIKKQTSGKVGEVERRGRRGTRVRSSLHLSPLSSFIAKEESRRKRGKEKVCPYLITLFFFC